MLNIYASVCWAENERRHQGIMARRDFFVLVLVAVYLFSSFFGWSNVGYKMISGLRVNESTGGERDGRKWVSNTVDRSTSTSIANDITMHAREVDLSPENDFLCSCAKRGDNIILQRQWVWEVVIHEIAGQGKIPSRV